MSILSPDVHQDGNTSAGHLAGRDVNAQTTIHNHGPRPQTHMGRLINKYADEAKQDPHLRETMKQLQNYQLPRSTFVGLERKLKLAAWPEDEIEWATLWKETFAKRLEQISFSPAAQEIVVYVLGKVHNLFKIKIRPLINEGTATREEVDVATIRDVLEPVFAELEDNPLGLCSGEISGALYFLTGNCHLRWDRF